MGEQSNGASFVSTNDIEDENERMFAEIAAMQSQLSPQTSSKLMHKLAPPKVCTNLTCSVSWQIAFESIELILTTFLILRPDQITGPE